MSKICVQFDARKKKTSSCAQPLEWSFELGFTEQIPKVMEDNSEHFRAFWETLFGSERAKKSPEIYFRPKRFRTIFEKRTPIYSLAALLLGLPQSIYYLCTDLTLLNVRLPDFLLIDHFLYRLFKFYEKLKKICIVEVWFFFQLFCPRIIEFRYYFSCKGLVNWKDDTGSNYLLDRPLKSNLTEKVGLQRIIF